MTAEEKNKINTAMKKLRKKHAGNCDNCGDHLEFDAGEIATGEMYCGYCYYEWEQKNESN